jgi:hypothetical protein
VESLDFDDGNQMELTISIMPEQMERLQHFANMARVSLSRFLREGAELLAAEMAQERTGTETGAVAPMGALH